MPLNKLWMVRKMNTDKTELILYKFKLVVLQLKLVIKLKILVIFDQPLFMRFYVNTIARVCYSYMSKIARIRRFLGKENKKIVHVSFMSKLEYCNVFFKGLFGSTLQILQWVKMCC